MKTIINFIGALMLLVGFSGLAQAAIALPDGGSNCAPVQGLECVGVADMTADCVVPVGSYTYTCTGSDSCNATGTCWKQGYQLIGSDYERCLCTVGPWTNCCRLERNKTINEIIQGANSYCSTVSTGPCWAGSASRNICCVITTNAGPAGGGDCYWEKRALCCQ